jgi:pimeloyl-ACP methyl ester carboxylesterase
MAAPLLGAGRDTRRPAAQRTAVPFSFSKNEAGDPSTKEPVIPPLLIGSPSRPPRPAIGAVRLHRAGRRGRCGNVRHVHRSPEGHPVPRAAWLAPLVCLLLYPRAEAHFLPRPFRLDRLNRQLHGQVIDYTHNHGHDLRIYSPSLNEKRDLYVYLPPGYDPSKQYPLVIYLHGFKQDETGFLDDVVKPLDRAIASGKLPPSVIAVPDGSVHGLTCFVTTGTFFTNSNLGAFEDFIVHDVYDFVASNYPIRPEPQAHVLLGASMGGGAAYALAIKHPDRFKVAVAIFPPLNVRWISCRGRYMDNFDPCCWGWRTDFSRGHEVVGRFYGVITIRLGQTIYPLYGRDNPDIVNLVSASNPIEMLDLYDVKPGDLELFVAYGGKDQFNLDAQVESFLYRAREKQIPVGVAYNPRGRHDVKTALGFLPELLAWIGPRLEPYRVQ